ncbi:nickel-dependent lactate racemase, partial [Candidatus Bathyarchaeota archaeon]|nr:nickel-dependent lactate racemase [Candidatus Bathyarchaeota archaeon]
MRIELPYGHEKSTLNLDDRRLVGVYSPTDAEAVPDVSSEVVRSLENPIGMGSLRSVVRPGKRVAIAVDDNTRVTPVRSFLQPLLKHFGLRREDVVIIVALGTHRKMTGQEMVDKYGPELLEEYEVVNHAFDEKDQLKMMGKLPNGVPVWVNREFVNADVRISTGNIIPHFTSGWSGGSKTLLPGLAGEETVGWMHYIGAMDLPNAIGEVENSSRAVMDAFAREAGLSFIVNTVLNRGEKIVRVFTGDFVKAHREGIMLSKRIYSVSVPGRSDITVTSSYPADIEFWQGQKGLYSADRMTRKGGGIVLLTPCPEGVCVMHHDWADML